jgi:hypothetical protein
MEIDIYTRTFLNCPALKGKTSTPRYLPTVPIVGFRTPRLEEVKPPSGHQQPRLCLLGSSRDVNFTAGRPFINPIRYFIPSSLTSTHEEGLHGMKRLAIGLSRPCKDARRTSLTRGGTFCCHNQFESPAKGYQIRHASTQTSRPRTALFFPGNRSVNPAWVTIPKTIY